MKANELMIKDWVVGGSGEPFKIGIIDPDFLHWDEVLPIPLTPEILEKNGFVFMAGLWYLRTEERKPIQIVFKDNNVITLSINATPVPIGLKYVHQLQHVLRLWGIEKEIEL